MEEETTQTPDPFPVRGEYSLLFDKFLEHVDDVVEFRKMRDELRATSISLDRALALIDSDQVDPLRIETIQVMKKEIDDALSEGHEMHLAGSHSV